MNCHHCKVKESKVFFQLHRFVSIIVCVSSCNATREIFPMRDVRENKMVGVRWCASSAGQLMDGAQRLDEVSLL